MEGTTQTNTAATTSTANAHEAIQQSSVNVFTDDMQCIGIENWAKATVAAESLYMSHPPEKKNK
eukprot:4342872-Ditylum_brightwellii.AAC.1